MRAVLCLILCAIVAIVSASQSGSNVAELNICGNGQYEQSFYDWALPTWSSLNMASRTSWIAEAVQSAKSKISVMSSSVSSGVRGLVMVIGARHLQSAFMSLQLLKAHNDDLPIELFFVGSSTLPADARSSFEGLGVTLRDLSAEVSAEVVEQTVTADNNIRVGWKWLAAQRSSFDDMILVEGNVIALRDPASLFNSEEYTSTGALFFPTNYRVAANNPIWSVMGLTCNNQMEQDDAVMVINKHRMAAALEVALTLGRGEYHSLLRGGVDALRMGALAVGAGYSMSTHRVQYGGNNWIVNNERELCAHVRVHSSPIDASPLFVQLLNSQVVADETAVEHATCVSGIESHDIQSLNSLLPSFESSMLQLQTYLPDPISRVRPMACTPMTLSQMLDQTKLHAAEEFVVLDNIKLNQAKAETSLLTLTNTVCGFFICGPDNVDMQVAFWQLNTTRSGSYEVRMNPNANQYPNDTYIGLIRTDGVRDTKWCATPVARGSYVTLTMNMDNFTSYILGVAWAPPGRTTTMAIQIYYRGEVVSGFSGVLANASPFAVLTALLMLIITMINHLI